MASKTVLQTRLDEAETALHELQMGRREVSVAYDGKSVTYTRAKIGDLQAYIAGLKGQIGTGGRRPLGVRF